MLGRIAVLSLLVLQAGCSDSPVDAQSNDRANLGYEVVRTSVTFPGNVGTVLTVACPAGKKAINGGFQGDIVDGEYTHPSTPAGRPSGDGNAWEILGEPAAPTTTPVYVICISEEALVL